MMHKLFQSLHQVVGELEHDGVVSLLVGDDAYIYNQLRGDIDIQARGLGLSGSQTKSKTT